LLSLPVRVGIVLVIALAVARLMNWAIYTWAYNARLLGPWSPPPAESKSTDKRAGKAAKKRQSVRTWADHLPVIGWFRLRREASTHGRWYWLRPLLLELIFPVFIAWYYHFYVTGQTLTPGRAAAGLAPELNWQFVGHFVLFALMGIATFIDFDEQSIPDLVTIPGTIIGIVGAALAPAWLPYTFNQGGIVELHAGIPGNFPEWLTGWQGLVVALAILSVWGFALLDRRVILRRGLGKAVQYFFARMFRHPLLWKIVLGVTLGLIGFVVTCWWLNIARWPALMSSLLGLAFAGGLTWGVRISASHGLGVEALGFGDVTLMAMIGTYIGWQPSLLVFFIAPIVAILFVVARTLITGDNATPYGPYLCVATLLLLVYWNALWIRWAAPVFVLGELILGIVVACVVLMGVLLWIWRLIKQALGIGFARG
jgi:leader peptidase (prepilin peptidase) / N-methyltransferase